MIRILLVDDRTSILQEVTALIADEPEFQIVGVAENGRAAVRQAIELQPDIVLIDLEMSQMNGITATKHICSLLPQTKVIVLTIDEPEKYVVEAIQAGAKGYLLKNTLAEDLKPAIWLINQGFSPIESKLLAEIVADENPSQRHRLKPASSPIVPPQQSSSNTTKWQTAISSDNEHSVATYLNTNSQAPKILPNKLKSGDTQIIESSAKLSQNWQSVKWMAIALCGLTLWTISPPSGVEEQAWHLLAIFITTIVCFILKPAPMGAIAIAALAITVLTKTLSLEEGLIGFSSSTTWLTFSSYIIARAIIKTGLAIRIAYLFTSLLGKRTLFLSYGLLATDLVLSPAMPSGNARSGGVIFPLVKSLTKIYENEPARNATDGDKIGGFLAFTAYQGTQITTAMFVTAMVANPLMIELAAGVGIEISWTTWALAAFVPGMLSLLIMPLVIYILYPPKIKNTPKAPSLARHKLVEMGKVSNQEWLMLAIFFLLLFLWAFGDSIGGIESATTAIVGVTLLVFTKILSWQEILEEQQAWDILIWFSIVLTMATYLNELGFIDWVSNVVGNSIDGFSWQIAFLLLSVVYFYSGYFFVSKAARAGAMYPAFLTLALAVGTPPMYAALVLAFLMSLSGCLTHYSAAVAPMYYSSGYIDAATWIKLGFILSLVYFPVWSILGGIWWQALGLL